MSTAGVVTIGPGESTSAARTSMRRHKVSHLVVVDRGRVVGIVSKRDFGRVGRSRSDAASVKDVMTTDVVSATPATTVRQAAKLMRGRAIGSVLVVDGKQPIGLVTTTDLLDKLDRGTSLARGRGAAPRTAAREAMPPSLPRPVKLARDRSAAVPPPAHIRVIGGTVTADDRDDIARKLGRQLGKFASSIERTTVRLSDANGPRGGRDQVVQIKVVLSGLPSVIVEARDAVFQRAVARAIKAASIAVRSTLRRRRLKPLRRQATRSREAT